MNIRTSSLAHSILVVLFAFVLSPVFAKTSTDTLTKGDEFLLAVANNNLSVAQHTLHSGAAINYRSTNRMVINQVNVRADKLNHFMVGKGRYQYASGTAYDIALAQGRAAMVQWLLQNGANPAAGYFKQSIENTHFADHYPAHYLNLPYRERAKIVSVGEVLSLAVTDNDHHKAAQLLTIEPRAIHYQGNRLLPNILRLGKWQLANLFLQRGKDIESLNQYVPMLKTLMQSEPVNYALLERFLKKGNERKGFDAFALFSLALKKGDQRAMQMLVQHGTNINPKHQKPPLHLAIEQDKLQLTRFLLGLGANPNQRYGGTHLLHSVIANEKYELAQALLNNGADVNTEDQVKRTPIQVAIHKKDPRFTQLLLAHRADINRSSGGNDSLLHIAVRENKPGIVALLLKAGLSANLENLAKETPLLIAIRDSKLAIAKQLIQSGAKPTGKDRNNRTPLDIAINKKDLAYVKLLIQAKVNVNDADKTKDTPLIIAVQQVNIPLIKLLLQAGAKQKLAERYTHNTPLHLAINKADLTMMRLLLDAKAPINNGNSYKRTPLHLAVNKKHAAMVRLLMQYKPKLNTRDSGGKTPLQLGIEQQNLPITRLLLNAGAIPNTVDLQGNTPLLSAIIWRKEQIARLLIQKGARINVADNKGRTPLDIALSKGMIGIATTLRNAGAKTGEELGATGALKIKIVK